MNEIFDKALQFAENAHRGMTRKAENIPYIIHPLEAATIVASMTNDERVIAAALLHDTVEDAGITPEQILSEFGERVAELVASETENKRHGTPEEDTWQIRKQETLAILRDTNDIGVKMLWMGDKLSNMRGFYRKYLVEGDALWQRFNQKDPKMQAWYYGTIVEYTKELSEHNAWKEYKYLVEQVFGGVNL